jgi:hypothetical protein
MSDNSMIQKYTSRVREFDADSAVASNAEGAQDFGCFGFLRGTRDRAMMLELRKKTGNIRAIAYSWIQLIDFDATGEITLFYGTETITIKGRNLNNVARQQISLLGGILRHRVPWIVESNQSGMLQADKTEVVVEAIAWRDS